MNPLATMFPSYRDQSVDLQRKLLTGFFLREMSLKGLRSSSHVIRILFWKVLVLGKSVLNGVLLSQLYKFNIRHVNRRDVE